MTPSFDVSDMSLVRRPALRPDHLGGGHQPHSPDRRDPIRANPTMGDDLHEFWGGGTLSPRATHRRRAATWDRRQHRQRPDLDIQPSGSRVGHGLGQRPGATRSPRTNFRASSASTRWPWIRQTCPVSSPERSAGLYSSQMAAKTWNRDAYRRCAGQRPGLGAGRRAALRHDRRRRRRCCPIHSSAVPLVDPLTIRTDVLFWIDNIVLKGVR